jgi:hypothetical protein
VKLWENHRKIIGKYGKSVGADGKSMKIPLNGGL